jgi:hypothetical protein
MPPKDDDDIKRIRGGLKFLLKANKAAIKAASLLQQVLEDPSPADADALIKSFTYKVDGSQYEGRATKHQHEYLAGQTASARKFADAISRILIKMDAGYQSALKNLCNSLSSPAGKKSDAKAIAPAVADPQKGCCVYDSTEAPNVTKAFCYGGLQGSDWYPGPC